MATVVVGDLRGMRDAVVKGAGISVFALRVMALLYLRGPLTAPRGH
jgi:hypothetical protein